MSKVLGSCKECFHEITEEHEIENDNIYECPECFYPNTLGDMHDLQVPLDYKSERFQFRKYEQQGTASGLMKDECSREIKWGDKI